MYKLSDYLKFPKISCIYVLYCTEGSNQFYLGSTKQLKYRYKRHISDLRCNRHHNIRLQNCFNKYGIDSFELYILQECEENELLKIEQEWLDIYYDHSSCMNIDEVTFGGSGNTKKVYVYDKDRLDLINVHKSKTEAIEFDYVGIQLLGYNNEIYVSSKYIFSYSIVDPIILKQYRLQFDKNAEETEQRRLNTICKTTYQYDIETGQLLNQYKSGYEAVRQTGVNGASSASHRKRLSGGFLWSKDILLTPQEVLDRVEEIKYLAEQCEIKRKQNALKSRAKHVSQFNKDTGELIKTYSSCREASRVTGFDNSQISATCKGKYKTCKGFIWKYAD